MMNNKQEQPFVEYVNLLVDETRFYRPILTDAQIDVASQVKARKEAWEREYGEERDDFKRIVLWGRLKRAGFDVDEPQVQDVEKETPDWWNRECVKLCKELCNELDAFGGDCEADDASKAEALSDRIDAMELVLAYGVQKGSVGRFSEARIEAGRVRSLWRKVLARAPQAFSRSVQALAATIDETKIALASPGAPDFEVLRTADQLEKALDILAAQAARRRFPIESHALAALDLGYGTDDDRARVKDLIQFAVDEHSRRKSDDKPLVCAIATKKNPDSNGNIDHARTAVANWLYPHGLCCAPRVGDIHKVECNGWTYTLTRQKDGTIEVVGKRDKNGTAAPLDLQTLLRNVESPELATINWAEQEDGWVRAVVELR